MHTTECEKVRFFHNGDFSGNVTVVDKATGKKMEIPFFEIKRLVVEYVRIEKIQKLEGCKDDVVLGL